MNPAELVRHVTAGLHGAEERPGQETMATLVAAAARDGRHLVIRAGTGTGKTLAYLAGLATTGRRVVIATATKALQDQLAGKDLPLLADRLDTAPAGWADPEQTGSGPSGTGSTGIDSTGIDSTGIDWTGLDWAVLKGRSNYVCLQRLRELSNAAQGVLELDDMAAVTQVEIKRIAEWAGGSNTGDIAELDWSPGDRAWSAVSVGSDECPGRDRCPMGDPCFAEQARRRAEAADVVIVNTHLYGLDVASGGMILPDHDIVVFDEAHTLEDTMTDTVGVTITPGRFVALAATVRRIVEDPQLVGSIAELAEQLRDALGPHVGARITSLGPGDAAADVADSATSGDIPPRAGATATGAIADTISAVLADARLRAERASEVVTAIEPPTDDVRQRQLRARTMLGRTMAAIDAALEAGVDDVTYIGGTRESPRLEVAPLDVGPVLLDSVWSQRTGILTSATIPSSLPSRVGLPDERTDVHDVGSPFDYEANSLLYCALHLPNPNAATFRAEANDELEALITAARGRTLALFTSYRAMDEAATELRDRVDLPILTQRDLPKPALVKAFADDPETCLFATAGLFQGVDVPGETLSLVVIDRIPFPRPDDPLLSARREALGASAFAEIDVPRAATMLAQACGRLIRNGTDRGVVAVLDRRLGTARYRWDIVNALPPMRRTRHRADAVALLTEIASGGADART